MDVVARPRPSPLPDIIGRTGDLRRTLVAGGAKPSSPRRLEELPSDEAQAHAAAAAVVAAQERANAVNMEKIFKLLTHRHSVEHVDRHVHILAKLAVHLESTGVGCAPSDLPFLVDIVHTCFERVGEGKTIYSDSLTQLLRQLHGLVLHAAQAEVDDIAKLLATALHIMRSAFADLAAAAVGTFVACRDMCVRDAQGSVARAAAVAHVAAGLSTCFPSLQPRDRVVVLEVLADMVEIPVHCVEIAAAGCGPALCQVLADPDVHSSRERVAANDVLAAALESSEGSKLSAQLSTSECAGLLRDAVRRAVMHAESAAARAHRNDVLATLCLVADAPDGCAALMSAGLLEVLLRFTMGSESARRHPDMRTLRLTKSTEDFEFHKMALTLAIKMALCGGASGAKLLALLFAQIDPDSSARWTPAQQEELGLLSLAHVGSVAALHLQAYTQLRGNTRMLGVLERSLSPRPTPPAAVNSFFNTAELRNGVQGAHSDFPTAWPQRPQARCCLRSLTRICAADEAGDVRCDLGDQGALTMLVSFLERPLEPSAELVDVVMRRDALVLLSALCQAYPHNKGLFGAAGVSMVLGYLEHDPAVVTCVPEWEMLLAAAIECVWSCAVGHPVTEGALLAREGLFMLLDVAERCPPRLQALVLGALCDVTEREGAIKHVLAWKSPRHTTAELLLEMWRNEERDMRVGSSSSGLLPSRTIPLAGHLQRRQSLQLPSGGVAINEVFSNKRAKIFALLSRMDLEAVASGLTRTEDRVTLVTVRNYLRLKRGEVWTEIEMLLEREGVQPVEADAELLLHMRTVHVDMTERIQREQRAIHEQQAKEELAQETSTYRAIVTSPRPLRD